MNPLVKVKNLSKSYRMEHGNVQALNEVDVEIHRGEMVAIMGPSGSGKSTLLHLLGCLDKPSTGHYYLDSQDISNLNDRELAFIRATKIGFVFQSFNLIQQLCVYDNVEVPFLYRTEQVNAKELILQSVKRVGLSHRLYHLPYQLSGGETQRVAIARALAINPLLILADEPTGNLDTETGKTILKMFQDLNDQGSTIIMVTHDENVGSHCRRIIRMRDGKIISDVENAR
jgi:putative ABC transport system ATP-binding protein